MIGYLTHEQIEEVFKRNVLGRIGCNDGKRNYVVPINYVYHERYIIAHSRAGMKIEMMRKNPQVCFEVDEIITSTNWKSVIAWGEYQELTDQRDRSSAMRLFVDKMIHIKASSAGGEMVDLQQGSHITPIIYRIVITEKTGRFENE